MKKLSVIISVVGLVFGVCGSAFGLSVTTMSTAEDLAQTILGTGIDISNISYSGANAAAGTFSGGIASGIGMESGIILTTGTATNAVGPNSLDSDSQWDVSGMTTENDTPGDDDLDALIPGYDTHDAAVLEFDFESVGGDVYFRYVFASEEYNEWVNSEYNDVFGFFMDGANIALLPDGETPVAINNVNGASNPDYFKNNAQSAGSPFDIEYDGFTTVLTASFLGLDAGTHHMKLAIADAGDMLLDAAVLIEAGTFSDTPPDVNVPEPGTVLLLGSGLLACVALKRKGLKQ